jgi:hypothetical protein
VIANRDLTRLPKWAQREIERLTRDVEHYKARLEVGPEDSDTFASPYSDAATPLGVGTVIEFRFGERWDAKIMARLEGDRLIVSGGSRIAVFPNASNVVEVGVIA